MINDVADLLLDSRRILSTPGADKRQRLRTLLHLKRQAWLNRGNGVARVLGFKVRYLDARALDQLFREIFVLRYYDVHLSAPRPHIIDCGSNIGMSILRFKTLYPEASVIGFEPHPATHAILAENVARNRLAGVTVHQAALSDREGAVELFMEKERPLDMAVFPREGLSSVQVRAERLSSYLTQEVDLLKLDVEGAEGAIFEDIAGSLGQVKNVACEYHHNHRSQGRLSRILALLETAGFTYHLHARHHPDATERVGRHQDVLIYAFRRS
jgi:FkbM family methyltransferase